MEQTALYPRPENIHPNRGVYNGVDAALDFGDPAGELAMLLSGCGTFTLSWRAKITVMGKDRVRWLHNMVTNNIRDLPPNRGNYNFVLNAQGRILGDMYIFNRGDSLLLDTDHTQVEPLLAAMKRYIIMDKVEMEVAPATAYALCGPKSADFLISSGFDGSNMEPLEIREPVPGFAVVRGPVNKPGWYEVWLTAPEAVYDIHLKFGSQLVGTQALEWWRILQGIPHYGQDIRERDLPQETGQTQALNFNKGCYIGQEIVERIRSRGQVHRKFTGFIFEDELPVLGKHESDGRTVAEVTSVAAIPSNAGVRNLGLGYVRREAVEAGPEIELKGHKAKIVDLPFPA